MSRYREGKPVEHGNLCHSSQIPGLWIAGNSCRRRWGCQRPGGAPPVPIPTASDSTDAPRRLLFSASQVARSLLLAWKFLQETSCSIFRIHSGWCFKERFPASVVPDRSFPTPLRNDLLARFGFTSLISRFCLIRHSDNALLSGRLQRRSQLWKTNLTTVYICPQQIFYW